jgi:hypothetical protein
MSYYYPYSRVLEAENALRRSRLAAEIAASSNRDLKAEKKQAMK